MLKITPTHEIAQSVIIQVKSYDEEYVDTVLRSMTDSRNGGGAWNVLPRKAGPMEWECKDDGMGRLRVTWTRGTGAPTAAQYRRDVQPKLQKMYPDAAITVRRDPLPRVRAR